MSVQHSDMFEHFATNVAFMFAVVFCVRARASGVSVASIFFFNIFEFVMLMYFLVYCSLNKIIRLSVKVIIIKVILIYSYKGWIRE